MQIVRIIRKLAAYVILGINLEGRKEVLTIEVGQNESSKFWLSVLNTLKNRGVKDVMIICADSLTGIREAINTAFPQTEYQRCIVHQVRNTLKYVADKDRKAFSTDLKKIYNAPDAERGAQIRDEVEEKWSEKYPWAMKSWRARLHRENTSSAFQPRAPLLTTFARRYQPLSSFARRYKQYITILLRERIPPPEFVKYRSENHV